MKILSRSGNVLFEADTKDLCALVERAVHRGIGLCGANLRDANLYNAYLWGADLREADLREADIMGADLTRAVLVDADIMDADLMIADLSGADLTRADLSGADLTRAVLRDADLSGAILPTGETWEDYLRERVPTLLTAGGKTVAEVLATGAWDCHDWGNNPIHVALGISSPEEAPERLRAQIDQFMSFFSDGLIPRPELDIPTEGPLTPGTPGKNLTGVHRQDCRDG